MQGVLRETVSDHYPVTFQIDPRQVINNANIQRKIIYILHLLSLDINTQNKCSR